MNLDPYFTRSPQFRLFKKLTGSPEALEYLFNLGSACAVKKTTELHLPLEYLGPLLDLPEDLNPDPIMEALKKLRLVELVEGKADTYSIKLFIDHNAQLIAVWKNGRLGGRPRAAYGESAAGPRESENPF